ncbi:SAM-dependent methyltransferase [Sulfitobacter sp. HNIBRBA2951]|uniref:SAM-dependent methyltransferase n=1 Tax=Sulfitobacter aquimarinus TaxID=3158557 RepID=UPI0032DE3519
MTQLYRAEMQPDISFIGVGLEPERHLTREAERALQESRVAFHLTASHEFICDLVGGTAVDLGDHYRKTASTDAYTQQVEMILSELGNGPGVAFVTYGHPMVLVDTCQSLLSHLRTIRGTWRVISGISSVAVMLERFTLDIGLAGLLVIEANKMVINQVRPNPSVASFIMQVGAFGALDLTLARRNHPDRFVKLRDYLLQDYSPEHPAVFITCGHLEGMEDIMHHTTVNDMADDADLIHTGMSLYLPPAAPNQDDRIIREMSNPQNVFHEG